MFLEDYRGTIFRLNYELILTVETAGNLPGTAEFTAKFIMTASVHSGKLKGSQTTFLNLDARHEDAGCWGLRASLEAK
jgi:hypothetical protein